MSNKTLASIDGPLVIDERSLSAAWARAFLHIIDHAGTSVSPMVLSISGFDSKNAPLESSSVRGVLDALLVSHGALDVEDVAYTIFPQRLWLMAQGDRQRFYQFCRMAFPRYQAMNKQANRRGLYFERIMSYGRGECDGNQLEWMLSQHEQRGGKGVRKSMYQASVFDPERDHIPDARIQFPCLQHVTFNPTKDGLVVNAFYATQQLLMKAYGNYLGISRMGAFMASQMESKLFKVNVFVGIAKFDDTDIKKTSSDLAPLLAECRSCLAKAALV